MPYELDGLARDRRHLSGRTTVCQLTSLYGLVTDLDVTISRPEELERHHLPIVDRGHV